MIYAANLREVERRSKSILEHNAGRYLLGYGLLKEYGIDLSTCTILKNEHGKPFLKEYPDIFFNISHCRHMAVCVLDRTPVGIDVEGMRACKEGLMKRVLSPEEYEKVCANKDSIDFFKYWTLKEAYGKALGIGMLYNYADMTFKLEGRNIVCPDKDYQVWQKIINNELVVTVCRKQPEAFEENIEYVTIDYNELEEER